MSGNAGRVWKVFINRFIVYDVLCKELMSNLICKIKKEIYSNNNS